MLVIHKWPKVRYHCFLGGLLGGALDIVGGIIGADMQNSASEHMQDNNIQWQKEQLQNKHQWEVEDLRKAGLNPILSAPNASSAVSAGSPQGANPNIQLSKSLEAIANSSLMKKQEEIAQYDADTRRISAEAEWMRAEQEKARTSSAVGLNEATSGYYVKQTEMLDKNYELQKAYTEANVREIDQRIINSVAEVKAKIQYLADTGRAALITASAHQTSAFAALKSAEAQEIIAQVAAENGISVRQLNEALEGKASQETKEAWQRTQNLLQTYEIKDWQYQKDIAHNPIASGRGNIVNSENFLFGVGEVIRNGWNPSNLTP